MNLLTELHEGIRISWSAIRANKLRSGLTTLGVVIGILTVTLMGTAIEGVNRSFRLVISQMGADVLYITRFDPFSNEEWWRIRNRRELTFSQAAAIERLSTFAEAVVTEGNRMMSVRRGNVAAQNVVVVGTTSLGFLVHGFSLSEGRFLTEEEVEGGRPVCVLGADTAEKFFRDESPIGERIKLDGQTFEVIGIMAPTDKFMGMGNDNHIIIPITQLVSVLNYSPDLQILVKVRDMNSMEDAKDEIRGILRTVRRVEPGGEDDFGVTGQDAFLQMFNHVGGTIAAAGLFITGLSLFVGGIGIMNIMFVSVAERTREIGIRKAIGAKRRTILLQFLTEAAMICLLGGLIGLAIAFPITLMMQRFLPAALTPFVVTLALSLSIVTGLIAGFMPAYRAARMNPVDALRSE